MGRRIWILTKITYLDFTRDNCTQLAAAISYYVLFSIVPLTILAVSMAGLIFGGESVRNSITNRILDAVPLSQTEGRSAVESALDSVKRVSGPVAAAGLLGTLWTASAVFASIRKSLNAVWGVDEHRPWAQAKLVDLAQVGVLGSDSPGVADPHGRAAGDPRRERVARRAAGGQQPAVGGAADRWRRRC